MSETTRRVLCIDPGEKRIGLAISDPTGVIANPLQVIRHTSRGEDAIKIVAVAQQQAAICIVVGQALGDDGEETASSRHAEKLADAIRSLTPIRVILWDESGSTNEAQDARREMGLRRKQRQGHQDQIAATIILQSYLDSREFTENLHEK
ncbi:MAG: Holliday junction resolvase RuvX [Anaerolineaceae bacterium]|nr:Holliday junction resolvase RuvX [Anaerolineaceae bacterium]